MGGCQFGSGFDDEETEEVAGELAAGIGVLMQNRRRLGKLAKADEGKTAIAEGRGRINAIAELLKKLGALFAMIKGLFQLALFTCNMAEGKQRESDAAFIAELLAEVKASTAKGFRLSVVPTQESDSAEIV